MSTSGPTPGPTTMIGAQMYTLRDHIKTVSDAAKTCAKLKKMGYDALQSSAFGAEVTYEEQAKIFAGEGLVCAATHASLDQMKDVDKFAEGHKLLGCEYTALGGFGYGGVDVGQWLRFIAEFNKIATDLKARGVNVGYHNHSHELARLDTGERPYDLLMSKFDPAAWFELDLYWVAHGGAEPSDFIHKIAALGPDRLPCIHFKDFAITSDREPKMCEVGSGNLNWPSILDACKAAGVKWYLVERDQGDMDPFDSLKVSLDNMREMGLS